MRASGRLSDMAHVDIGKTLVVSYIHGRAI